ncbi:hypothetical protein [Actinoplanes sp. G11-F43]|uniref:hypothetical protein n=1 Tax=Actinoplanes sp. G11-F43 TaxID=3424130 RepID=UPI003D3575AB
MTSQEPSHHIDPYASATEVIAVPEPAPVFVDSTGRRSRLLRRIALAFGVVLIGYAGLVSVSLAGGPISSSAVLPLPGLDDDEEEAPEPRAESTPAPTPEPKTTTSPATRMIESANRGPETRRPASVTPAPQASVSRSKSPAPKPSPSTSVSPVPPKPVESGTTKPVEPDPKPDDVPSTPVDPVENEAK